MIAAAPHVGHARFRERLGRIGVPLFLVVILLIAVQRVIIAGTQIDWDEELYFQVAHFWKHGLVPYRDIFDHKPPMVYLFYMLTSWGDCISTVRGAVTVLLLGSVMYMFASLRHAGLVNGQQFLVLTPALCCLLSQGTATGANTELLYTPFLMLSAGSLLEERPFVSALCAALALAVKYTVVLDVIGIGVLYYFVSASGKERSRYLVAWVSTVLVVSIAIYTSFYIYFHYKGVDLIEAIFYRNIAHVSDNGAFDSYGAFAKFARIGAATSLAFALLCMFRQNDKRLLIGALPWLFLSVIQASITGQYYFHYFFPAFVPLVILWGSLKLDTLLVAPILAFLALVEGRAVHNSVQWLKDYESTAGEYLDICRAIDNRGYILTQFLAGYRICHVSSVDKFLFPPFYLDEHFAQVSGSGGFVTLRSKVESGDIRLLVSTPTQWVELTPLSDVGKSGVLLIADTAQKNPNSAL